MFGDNKLFDELDKLPKPDLIIASPPGERWSVASAMWGGNASWKQIGCLCLNCQRINNVLSYLKILR